MDSFKLFPHETLALLQNRFVVRDHALPSTVAEWANCYVRELSPFMRPARIGSGEEVKLAETFRGDSIMWLTAEYSTAPHKEPFATLKKWQIALERAVGFSFTRASVQLARYEGDGARYVRHSDVGKHHGDDDQRSHPQDRRIYTMVYYLNPLWSTEENKGQLRIYYGNAGEHYFDIEPIANRLVIFPSHLEHEVLPTFERARWALTIWLYVREVAPSPPLLIGSSADRPGNNQIFVSIACYRDQDVATTISNLFATAKNPSSIFVGVCWQGDEAPPAIKSLDVSRLQQIRWCLLPREAASGPLSARNIILNRLYAQERYVLQIDAHSRFAHEWDARLIGDLLLCPSDKPILTGYPAGFRLDTSVRSSPSTMIDHQVLTHPSPILCADRFDKNGVLRIVGRQPNSMPPRPKPCLFWAAGFSFSEARAFFTNEERPNIPYLFFGEETLMAYYFFRHGWQLFTPGGPNIIFHLWNSRSLRPETSLVVSNENKTRANMEYHKLMESYRDSDSFAAYEAMIGVNYKAHVISDRARLGGRSSWTEFKVGAALPKKALDLIDQYLC